MTARFWLFIFLLFFGVGARAEIETSLSRSQIQAFRAWIVMIIEDQVRRGPNPRWYHRDCAGLLRFAVSETLLSHNLHWRKANGFLERALPAEIELDSKTRERLKLWQTSDDGRKPFARALPLIQNNTEFLGKTIERIEPGDLLFFDQGDEQHLMIWTGRRIIYHNGAQLKPKSDDPDYGLRSVTLEGLLNFSDTRWQPAVDNPNFIGFFRLSFLVNRNLFSAQ